MGYPSIIPKMTGLSEPLNPTKIIANTKANIKLNNGPATTEDILAHTGAALNELGEGSPSS